MSHIFISYSKQDIEFARHLRQLLQAHGFAVWMDETRLVSSERWWPIIERNIITCAAFVVIMSPNGKDSEWIEREILIAEDSDHRKPIFPVLLEGKQWSRLANIQYQDMRRGIKASTLHAEFVEGLRRYAPTSGGQAPSPLQEPVIETASLPLASPSKRVRWVIATVGLFLIIGTAAIVAFLKPNKLNSPTLGVPTDNIPSTEGQPTRIAVVTSPTFAFTSTVEPTVTFTPTITLTPTRDAFATVTSNAEWNPFIRMELSNRVEMMLVPAGCFQMGSTEEQIQTAIDQLVNNGVSEPTAKDATNNEKPAHRVCFDEPFWIDQYEVTNQQYGSEGYFKGDHKPRETISWTDAEAFCKQRDARLPTEAEWEYAARGPDGLIYPWGNEFVGEKVVYYWNSDTQTHAIGSKKGGVSWVGAYDLSGNVWEWVADRYGAYSADEQTDPQGIRNGSSRVLRGGSWDGVDVSVRAASRLDRSPGYGNSSLGFRCARSFD